VALQFAGHRGGREIIPVETERDQQAMNLYEFLPLAFGVTLLASID
jgi:hypothetical protein